MVRDIVIFGPTHIARELGLLLWDAGLLPGAVFIPSEADVGSAKQEREHPPGLTGLNFALHGHAGLRMSKCDCICSFLICLSHII